MVAHALPYLNLDIVQQAPRDPASVTSEGATPADLDEYWTLSHGARAVGVTAFDLPSASHVTVSSVYAVGICFNPGHTHFRFPSFRPSLQTLLVAL